MSVCACFPDCPRVCLYVGLSVFHVSRCLSISKVSLCVSLTIIFIHMLTISDRPSATIYRKAFESVTRRPLPYHVTFSSSVISSLLLLPSKCRSMLGITRSATNGVLWLQSRTKSMLRFLLLSQFMQLVMS